MVDAAMRCFAEEGYDYVTLGLAPLSRRAPATPITPLPWLHFLLSWARAHGKRFYNFDGLDAFKAKFRPDAWEPLYAISNEPRFSLRTLYAIAGAFSDGPPLRALARAIVAALRQETLWLRKRLKAGSRETPPIKPG
jgi:phosphatidylglycerol lysyltransferase